MFPNFSLMPCTGGMNNKKGRFGYSDRFDEFIYYISQYYKIKCENEKYEYVKNILWSNPQKKEVTISALCSFLDLFKDEYDYCKRMYFIDNTFVDELINNGEKTAHDGFDCKRHCELAQWYWDIRKEIMHKKIPKAEQMYADKNINDNKYK